MVAPLSRIFVEPRRRRGRVFHDRAALHEKLSAERDILELRIHWSAASSIVECGSDRDLLVGRGGQLIVIGTLVERANAAQIDRRRAAAGRCLCVEAIWSGDRQRYDAEE